MTSPLPSSAREMLPEQLAVAENPDAVLLTLRVPATLACFPGHFPASPILPGVFQLEWAVHFGRRHFPIAAHFKKMEALKFQAIIEPEQIITLQLAYKPDTGKLVFSFDSSRGKHSSGRIVFGAESVATAA